MSGYDSTLKLDARADSFEYIMYGKIFKYAEEKSRACVEAILQSSMRGVAFCLTVLLRRWWVAVGVLCETDCFRLLVMSGANGGALGER